MQTDKGSRIWILVIVLGLLLVLSQGVVYDFFTQQLPWTFYPGFILGVILVGIPFYRYIMKIWDPTSLSMKKSYRESGKKPSGWMWGAPLGVLTANIIMQLFGREFSMFVGGFMLGWLYAFFGFLSFQAWWHRPK